MRQADWIDCPAPDLDPEQYIHLVELTCIDAGDNEYTMNIYVHYSGDHAISEIPIGGGWSYRKALIDRRSNG